MEASQSLLGTSPWPSRAAIAQASQPRKWHSVIFSYVAQPASWLYLREVRSLSRWLSRTWELPGDNWSTGLFVWMLRAFPVWEVCGKFLRTASYIMPYHHHRKFLPFLLSSDLIASLVSTECRHLFTSRLACNNVVVSELKRGAWLL